MPSPHHLKNILHGKITAGGNVIIGDTTYTNNYFPDREVKIPHLLSNNIPTNADHILGRDTELTTISEHLRQHKPTVLVNGIGGIGKTSVAAKYMATFGNQYKHLAWLTVQSSLEEAFTNDIALLTSLDIEQKVRQLIEKQRLTDAFKLVVHQLNTLDSTLVVLDNANGLEDLMTYKSLFDTAKCHYLITSRAQPQEWTVVPIDALPEDEAVALFRKLAPLVQTTDEALKSLLSKLFYHTLLIELVAKAVANAGFSFEELSSMIQTKFIHDATLNEEIVYKGKHGDNYDNEAKRTKIEEYIWLIFSNVKDLGDDAKLILKGMALLPVAMPFDRTFLKEHLALFEVKDVVPNLSLLVEWGWLHKEGKGFKMHPLVADVVVKHLNLNVSFAEVYITSVAELIGYDDANPRHNLFAINKNKPLADRLGYLFFEENTEGVSELLDKLGYLEANFDFYQKGAYYRERALKIAESIFDENHAIVAERQNNLARMYHYLGKYDKATQLLEMALSSDFKNFGKEHSTVAERQNNLAQVYRDLGKYDKAIQLLEAVLASDLKNYGQEHPYVSMCQNNLATVYQKLGKYEQAAALFKAALTNGLKNFGQEHPNVALYQWNLAEVYINTDRKSEAKILLQQAYQYFLKNFGLTHSYSVNIQTLIADTE